jgi:type VI secretion system ImpA family protein
VNVDTYLAPISEDDPAGPDSFDLPGRGEVEGYFERDEEEIPASEWPGLVKQVVALAGETRDLWVAIKLMEAGARAGDLQTVDEGGQLLAGLTEGMWEAVHPKLEDYGFESRANTCASLTKIRDFLGPLRRTTLYETRIGKFSGEDLERFALEGDAAENYGLFRASIEQLRGQGQLESTTQEIIDRLDSIRDSVRRTDRVLTDNSGSETSTNFQPTYEALEGLRKLLVPYAGLTGEEALAAEEGALVATATSVGAMPAGGRMEGRVESRDDVVRVLDAIGDYYRLREPSSPVPVLLRRARQWVSMDFMAVLNDLVPNSVEDARNVLLSKQDQRDEESY